MNDVKITLTVEYLDEKIEAVTSLDEVTKLRKMDINPFGLLIAKMITELELKLQSNE